MNQHLHLLIEALLTTFNYISGCKSTFRDSDFDDTNFYMNVYNDIDICLFKLGDLKHK